MNCQQQIWILSLNVHCNKFHWWMEVYPIPNQDATTVANKLVNEFICRFSVSKQLHGAQFESWVVAEVCKLIKH